MGTHSMTVQTDGPLTISADLASSGTGTLTIEPASVGTSIGVNATSGSTLLITPTDLGDITSQGWANFTIGRSDGTGTITLPATTYASTGNTTFAEGSSGSINLTGTQTGTGTTSFIFNGPTTLSYAGTEATTSNEAITFNSAL